MRRGPPNMVRTVRRFSFPVLRRRFGPGIDTADGLTLRGEVEEVEGLACVWPTDGTRAVRLPDGTERMGRFEGASNLEFQPADESNGTRGDQIVLIGDGGGWGALWGSLWGAGDERVLEVVACRPWLSGRNGVTTWWSLVLTEVQP